MLLSSGSIVPNSWVREESMINTSVGAKEALYQAADALNEDSVGDLQLARLEVIRPSIPVLLVWGEDDSWTPIEMGFRAQQAIPRAELAVMKNCGHAPYFENPEEFAEIVRHFIDFEKKDEV
ncbi:hypothetical protein BJF89_16355 [Corynebacterium sp. CNJ-954]|nr:hypothetical protein BJF89_16355 [Corynebacterium sp. CNJ-954]